MKILGKLILGFLLTIQVDGTEVSTARQELREARDAMPSNTESSSTGDKTIWSGRMQNAINMMSGKVTNEADRVINETILEPNPDLNEATLKIYNLYDKQRQEYGSMTRKIQQIAMKYGFDMSGVCSFALFLSPYPDSMPTTMAPMSEAEAKTFLDDTISNLKRMQQELLEVTNSAPSTDYYIESAESSLNRTIQSILDSKEFYRQPEMIQSFRETVYGYQSTTKEAVRNFAGSAVYDQQSYVMVMTSIYDVASELGLSTDGMSNDVKPICLTQEPVNDAMTSNTESSSTVDKTMWSGRMQNAINMMSGKVTNEADRVINETILEPNTDLNEATFKIYNLYDKQRQGYGSMTRKVQQIAMKYGFDISDVCSSMMGYSDSMYPTTIAPMPEADAKTFLDDTISNLKQMQQELLEVTNSAPSTDYYIESAESSLKSTIQSILDNIEMYRQPEMIQSFRETVYGYGSMMKEAVKGIASNAVYAQQSYVMVMTSIYDVASELGLSTDGMSNDLKLICLSRCPCRCDDFNDGL